MGAISHMRQPGYAMATGHTQDDVLGIFFALNVKMLRWAPIWAHLLLQGCEWVQALLVERA